MHDTWAVGQTIDNLYEIFGVSSGGMGSVYFVNHLKWKIPLAVKTPLPTLVSSPSAYSRYIKEAETWINIGMHPNIVSCFYVREIGGIPRIFVEYVGGGTLKDLIDNKRLGDLGYVLDLAIQIAMAMEYVHDLGIIHRDIKPANCMITSDGEVKLTDFGIAKFGDDVPFTDDCLISLSSQEGLTMTGVGFGTPEYMAPEQFLDAKHIGKEADIYAFGVMLYEMVCGTRPFVMPGGMHSQARDYYYRSAHFNQMPLPPIDINQRIPKSLNNLISKCLAKDYIGRPSSFSEITTLLQGVCPEIGKFSNRIKPDIFKLRADSYNNRAVSFLELGKNEEAEYWWKQALKEDPKHLESTFNYGYYHWQRSAQYHEVLGYPMSNLKTAHEGNTDFWRLLAWLHYEQGELDALEELQNSHQKVSDPELLSLYKEIQKYSYRCWHSVPVYSAAFSPDGKYVLSGGLSKDIILWEVESSNEIRRFEGDAVSVNSVAFSPDGNYVLSGSDGMTIMLWEVISGKEVRRFEGFSNAEPSDAFSPVAFSPDGKYILSGSIGKTIRLWDMTTGKESKRFVLGSNEVTSLAFSPDGNYILSSSFDRSLILWDVTTGREIRRFEVHSDDVVFSVAFSPCGRYVLSGSYNPSIRLRDLETGKELRRFEGHIASVKSVAFSPNGRYILSGGADRTIRVWDVATGKELRRFGVHSDCVSSVAFSPDGSCILSCSWDKTVRIFPWEPLRKVSDVGLYPLLSYVRYSSELLAESRVAQSLLISATNCIERGFYSNAYMILRQIQLIPGNERNKEVLDLASHCGIIGGGKRRGLKACLNIATFKEDAFVTAINFSPDDNYVISDGGYDTIRIWQISTSQTFKRLYGHSDIRPVAFSPEGRFIVTGGLNYVLRLWDVVTGTVIRAFEGHSDTVKAVAFSSDGRYILSGSRDETLRLWDVATGKELRQFEGHRIVTVSFSPDDNYLLTGSSDKTIRLREILTGKEVKCFEGHSKWIHAVAFSSDGCHVLSGSRDTTIRLWDVATGKEARRFEGHTDRVNSIAFSPDGSYILSGGADRTIRLWNSATGREFTCIEGHSDSVNSVKFSNDGRYVLSGGDDCTIKLWEIDWEWEFP